MMTDNAARYRDFWTEFGRAIKEGLLNDPDNRDAILEISSFASTHHDEDTTNLRQYVERMKEGQEDIYFMTGESRATITNSPHMEAFQAKGYEVLLLTDPVDEVWVDMVPEFDGKTLRSIAKGQVDLDTEAEKETASSERERQTKDFAALLAFMAATLKDDVKDVRLSSRLTTSPACIVGDADDVTPALARMYQAMGQQLPPVKRILELNATHPLIAGLRTAHEERGDDEALAQTVELLLGTALLAEGGELTDPARFARLLAERLARTL
jgi:molecular chaperone HtpG